MTPSDAAHAPDELMAQSKRQTCECVRRKRVAERCEARPVPWGGASTHAGLSRLRALHCCSRWSTDVVANTRRLAPLVVTRVDGGLQCVGREHAVSACMVHTEGFSCRSITTAPSG
jgi:hypothetical protein